MLYPYEREALHKAHTQLVSNRLAVWTSGNASMRLPNPNMILIKPSGVLYEDLTPNSYIVVGTDGKVVENGALSTKLTVNGIEIIGDLYKPSTDTLAHCYLYRKDPMIHAVVHTHSPAATAMAARRASILCCTTEQADNFGMCIPCAPLVEIGDESMGIEGYTAMSAEGTKACLLANHGVLTVGADLREAVRHAVMVEHIAQIACYHRGLGIALSVPQVKSCFERYHTSYGQHT